MSTSPKSKTSEPSVSPAKKPAAKKPPAKKVSISKIGAAAKRIGGNAKPSKQEIEKKIQPGARRLVDVLSDRVTMDKSQLSGTLSTQTTPGEFVQIIGYLADQAGHVGFVLGDMLNQGAAIFGEKYTEAIAATGYSESTLKSFCSVAGNYSPALREMCPKIEFSAAREITALPAPERTDFVKAIAAEVKDGGEVPAVKEIRKRVKKITDAIPKPARKARAKKPAEKPYDLTASEHEEIQLFINSVRGAFKIITPELEAVMLKMDNDNKQAVINALKPPADLCKAVEKSL